MKINNLYRLIIKKDVGDYFIGKSFTNKSYKIVKNKVSEHFTVGDDYHFFAYEKKKLIWKILEPISDTEAGIIER